MSRTQTIDAERLHTCVAPLAARHRLQGGDQSPLMDGFFASHRLGNGMTLHCVGAQELADCASTGDCPAGLSFTFLLAGAVTFCLGSRLYRVDAEHEPLGLGLQLAQAEPFTRYLSRGQKVRKVNVRVSSDWLRERFGALPRWIEAPTGVVTWLPTSEQLQLASDLMALSDEPAAGAMLIMEARVLELVASVLNADHFFRPRVCRPIQSKPALDRLVEPCVHGQVTLKEVAQRLGMSVSTLQRRFKRDYGVTVMDYLRQQRLDLARHALLADGCSVQQAAYLAGYDHASNFIPAFKRRFGVTPAGLVRRHFHTD